MARVVEHPGYLVTAMEKASLQAMKDTLAPVLGAIETKEAADVARALDELGEALARLRETLPY